MIGLQQIDAADEVIRGLDEAELGVERGGLERWCTADAENTFRDILGRMGEKVDDDSRALSGEAILACLAMSVHRGVLIGIAAERRATRSGAAHGALYRLKRYRDKGHSAYDLEQFHEDVDALVAVLGDPG